MAVRQQVIALLRATSNPMYTHEQGEPFTTCLALRDTLEQALRGRVKLNITELRDVMAQLKDEWDNVIMARKRALGARITEAYVTSSQEMTDFVSYLDYLSENGFGQGELDQMYVSILNYALNGDNNGY